MFPISVSGTTMCQFLQARCTWLSRSGPWLPFQVYLPSPATFTMPATGHSEHALYVLLPLLGTPFPYLSTWKIPAQFLILGPNASSSVKFSRHSLGRSDTPPIFSVHFTSISVLHGWDSGISFCICTENSLKAETEPYPLTPYIWYTVVILELIHEWTNEQMNV